MGVFAFRILGPLEISYEDRLIPVRGVREQAVLGVLLLEAAHVVPMARLVDVVWDSDPPHAAEKAVRNTVSALRVRFAQVHGTATVIETGPAGYRLRLDGHWLDAAEFKARVEAARKLMQARRAREAVAQYRAALGLWRGPVLAGLLSRAIEPGTVRLQEQRLTVWEDCLDLELSLGRHRQVTDELRGLAGEWPLRERLAGQLMLALYRSGRQAEALAAYQELAGTLTEELGIDPSGEIIRLHEAILRQDRSLDNSHQAAGERRTAAVKGTQRAPVRFQVNVPADDIAVPVTRRSDSRTTVGFVGRERELARLARAFGRGTVVLIVGDEGVGKTGLCAEAMARASSTGILVTRGECLPVADTLPLLLVADAVRALGKMDDGALLASALDAVPGFVQAEVGRLLPELGLAGERAASYWDAGWRRERLFSAIAELLTAVARGSSSGLGLVIEDVHWADSATLDCLTFLTRAGDRGAITVVVTCRRDEAPLAAHVIRWLADMRSRADVEEIVLGRLSRAEAAELAGALTAGTVRHLSPQVVDELYRRADGNPFFIEQLVAAALAGPAGDGLRIPEGLPLRLAELLVARSGRCAGDARAVLTALAVAGRPLTEHQLVAITGLESEPLRRALRELAGTRLLAETGSDGEYRPRHALLREAVVAELLPGERAALHECIARVLGAADGPSLAAEVARHWRAAGRFDEELPARITAAGAAEQVFGYAEAAVHWQRAIELARSRPDETASISVAWLHMRAIDALFLSGNSMLAEEHPDRDY